MAVRTKLLYIFLALALIGLMVLYVFEFYYFQRTFEVVRLVWTALGIGIVLGGGLGYWFSRDVEDALERVQVIAFLVMLTSIFLPLFASLSNRLLSTRGVVWETVAFIEEKPYVADRFGIVKGEKRAPNGFYLFVLRNGEMARLSNQHPLKKDYQSGDVFLLPVRKGLWGFSWALSERQGPWPAPPDEQ